MTELFQIRYRVVTAQVFYERCEVEGERVLAFMATHEHFVAPVGTRSKRGRIVAMLHENRLRTSAANRKAAGEIGLPRR